MKACGTIVYGGIDVTGGSGSCYCRIIRSPAYIPTSPRIVSPCPAYNIVVVFRDHFSISV